MKKIILMMIFAATATTMKAQSISDVTQKENKYIYNESIKLFYGDKIYVEANIDGKYLKNLHVVKDVKDSTKVLIIEFKWDFFGKNKSSILKITNPFDKTLHYKAQIRDKSTSKYQETSIIPIYPKIYSMEEWPYKIESIILYDFQLQK